MTATTSRHAHRAWESIEARRSTWRSRVGAVLGVAALAAALVVVAAPAANAAPSAPAARPQARPAASYAEINVTMIDNQFRPKTLTVDPETTVRWTNEGRNDHNVVPDKQGAGWGNPDPIKPGSQYERDFTEPGVYAYYCSFHGAAGRGMYGTVIVRNADGTLPKGAASVNKGKAGPAATGDPRTIRVPKDEKTIQGAVDAAKPGDLILVSPGTYNEAVVVTTDKLVIRGLDRNKTILDGNYELENGVKIIGANGVAVENMTAQRYTRNGFFWTGVKGYRGSYLTSTRTGDYGIYAFDSVNGQFDHDYGSGSPDAGFYIGQCFPCNAVITDSISEYNGLGYSGTNAGGNLIIKSSIWRHNRAGIVPNSGDGEANPPEKKTTVVGNVVYANNNTGTPSIDTALLAQGDGILIAGGNSNLVTKNLVYDHDLAGIALLPNPDKTYWTSNDNKVIANVVRDSRANDLAWFDGTGNCFAKNDFQTSKPSNIEQVLPCTGTGVPATDKVDLVPYLTGKPEPPDYKVADTPPPPKLPGMKNARTAKAQPADKVVVKIKITTIKVPKPVTESTTTTTP